MALALLAKCSAFIPDNYWLWSYGPILREHVDHMANSTTPTSIEDLEKSGLTGCHHGCKDAPARYWTSLQFQTPSGAHGFGKVWRYIVRKLLWTPIVVLTMLTAAALTYNSQVTWRPLVALTAVLAAALALWTLIASVIVRLSLGKRDDEYSDLSGLPKLIQRRSGHETARQEGLALYFALMIVISVICFGVSYQAIYTIDPQAFRFEPDFPPRTIFGWLYFSLTVVATAADGSIAAGQLVSKLLVALQLCTGPLLLVWFVSLFLSED